MALFRVETRVQMDFRKSNQVSPRSWKELQEIGESSLTSGRWGSKGEEERDEHKVELQFKYDETIKKIES